MILKITKVYKNRKGINYGKKRKNQQSSRKAEGRTE